MTEQYVYTIAKLERGSSSGFTRRTEGIVGAVQQEVLSIAAGRELVKDGTGSLIPAWDKRTLSGKRGLVLLQQTVRRRTGEGMIQQSSGYVMESSDNLLTCPSAWGTLDFQVQEEFLRRAPQPNRLDSLPDVLEYFQLDEAQLLALIHACFYVQHYKAKCLIGLDFTRQNALHMGAQLLMWIYSLLPFSLRRELNCTTCFDGNWNSAYHLALVPATMLEESGHGQRGFFAGSGILFYRGNVENDPGAKGMRVRQQNGLYTDWLKSVIHQVLNAEPARIEQLLTRIDSVYRRFDAMIQSLPEREQMNLRYYDALCWSLMRQSREESEELLRSPRDLSYCEDLLAFGSWPDVLDAMGDMLTVIRQVYTTPASAQLIRIMSRIVQLDGTEEVLQQACELLTACLSRDMEAAEMGECSAVSARYLQIMTRSGMERGSALQFLGRSFFPGDYPISQMPETQQLWAQLGTDRSVDEGIRRCNDWMSSYVNVCLTADELIECADTVIRELEGFPQRLMERALDCLLGAQESRSYYAKLEILPGHLTGCARCIADAWDQVPDQYRLVAERYYAKLLELLSREYLNYWSGRSNLLAVCNLADTYRRDGWYKTGNEDLKELLIAQCADICEYSWELLKEQFEKEGGSLLQRLWRILDLLEELGAGRELRQLLTRQVSRYVLHRVPSYVNDNWIVCEVRERYDLKREGYYLELLTVREFFQGKDQSLTRLQACIKKNHVPTELMKDMMKFLYRVFQQGGANQVDIAAVEGLYLASRDRLKVSQADVFRTVCTVRGGKALIELINCWPTAPADPEQSQRQQERTSARQRQGKYLWMKTTRSLLESILRLTGDREALARAARGNELFYLEFAEAVNELVPVGCRGRGTAVKINERLLTLQEERAGFRVRMRCNASRRRLLAEQKG